MFQLYLDQVQLVENRYTKTKLTLLHAFNFSYIFQLYQDQVQLLLDAFKNPPQTREEGIYFDDRQYKCVRADKTSVYGKCVGSFYP